MNSNAGQCKSLLQEFDRVRKQIKPILDERAKRGMPDIPIVSEGKHSERIKSINPYARY